MKKIMIGCFALAVLAACNNNSSSTSGGTEEKKPDVADITANPDYAAGLELVGKSDCFTCHKVDEKMTGPSYRDVANKYASQAPGIIPGLAEKIVKGGSGVWGEVAMLPHASITQADAEAMVKYILLLKK